MNAQQPFTANLTPCSGFMSWEDDIDVFVFLGKGLGQDLESSSEVRVSHVLNGWRHIGDSRSVLSSQEEV